MITVQKFIETIDFKITGGSSYQWRCFGPNARWLDSEYDNEYSASIVFDSLTQTVYTAEVCDFVNNRAYRWSNPEYATAYTDEATSRNVKENQAWDDINYYELDVPNDWLEKCKAISNKNFEYDTRVMIALDLTDAELLQLMKLAHSKDITLNQLVEEILKEVIQKHSIE
jgi:predicted HicB family RNase H-like nuclease